MLLQQSEVKVIDGRVSEFVELQREYAEAARAEDRRGHLVWQVLRGRTNTFQIVDVVGDFASYDDESNSPVQEEWVTRALDTIESRVVINLRSYSSLSIPPPDGEQPGLAVLRIRTVKPGRNDEYRAWIEKSLAPALRKGGATGVSWFRVVAGGNTNTWFSTSRQDNWSEMDQPGPLDSMSDKSRNALLDKAAELTMGNGEDLVIRYRPDMSY